MTLRELAILCAQAGYTQGATAVLLNKDTETIHRAAYGVKFGHRGVPGAWGRKLEWINEVPINIRPVAKKLLEIMEKEPQVTLRRLCFSFPGLGRWLTSEWQERALAELKIRRRIGAIVSKLMAEGIPVVSDEFGLLCKP